MWRVPLHCARARHRAVERALGNRFAFGGPLQVLRGGPLEVRVLQEPASLYPWLTAWDTPKNRTAHAPRTALRHKAVSSCLIPLAAAMCGPRIATAYDASPTRLYTAAETSSVLFGKELAAVGALWQGCAFAGLDAGGTSGGSGVGCPGLDERCADRERRNKNWVAAVKPTTKIDSLPPSPAPTQRLSTQRRTHLLLSSQHLPNSHLNMATSAKIP